jgi:hypothetical protein
MMNAWEVPAAAVLFLALLTACTDNADTASRTPVTVTATANAAKSTSPTDTSSAAVTAAPDVVAKFDLPARPEAPVFTAGTAWIPTAGGQLARVDAATNTSEMLLKGAARRGGVYAMSAFESIWFWQQGKGLFRLEPDTGAVIERIPEEIEPWAVGFGSLWGMVYGHKIVRIDPNTNEVVARLRVSDEEAETHVWGCVEPFRETCPDYMTVHEDSVVVFVDGEDAVFHIDPATNQVTKRVTMPANPSGLYRLSGDDPWLMTESGLAQIDLDSGEILKQIPLENSQQNISPPTLRHAIAINGDTAWLVANYTTTQIDLKRAEVVKTFDTPGAGGVVVGASFGHGDLWVAYAGGTVRRLDLPET